MKINCLTYIPGDSPGDPDLGGWRPIPNNVFKPILNIPTTNIMQDLQILILVEFLFFSVSYLTVFSAVQKFFCYQCPAS